VIQIIDYTDEASSFIRDLNYEWLQKYFEVEPNDELQLNNPRKEIIDKGGRIYYATFDGGIVGTATLIHISPGIYELGKMAVTERMQGKGIARKLLEHCLSKARELKAEKIILYSNTKLKPAINLYRKFGFEETPLKDSHYARSDIKMEKAL